MHLMSEHMNDAINYFFNNNKEGSYDQNDRDNYPFILSIIVIKLKSASYREHIQAFTHVLSTVLLLWACAKYIVHYKIQTKLG
jgi:hypothetical protein